MLGEHNVLVVAPDPLWTQVGDSVREALQARPVGLLPESTFRLTQRAPERTSADDLKSFRQVVVMGGSGDALVQEALRTANPPSALPAVVSVPDVWRVGQQITVLVSTEAGDATAVLKVVPDLASVLDRNYRDWTARRTYAGGVNAEMGDSLAAEGFGFAIPELYRGGRVSDSVFRFTTPPNDRNPVVRSVLVTWRPGNVEQPSAASVLAWRQAVAHEYYEGEQVTRSEPLQVQRLDPSVGDGLELQGVWNATIDGRGQGGPFLTRLVDCPGQDRQYLIDAWVSAPEVGKYRYLIQLETVLDSFDCR